MWLDETQRHTPAYQQWIKNYLFTIGRQWVELPKTTREFWKHTIYGEVYAVELVLIDGKREVVAARKCRLPEEQTRGALPVITIYADGEDVSFVSNNTQDFGLWEPPMTRDDAIENFRKKVEARKAAGADYERQRKSERAALKHYDKCVADELAAGEALVEPAEAPPLIAIAEARPVDPATPGSPTTTLLDASDEPQAGMTPDEFNDAFGDDKDDDDLESTN